MIKNYFHIAIRNILRERSYSLINIFGLIAGFTAFLWITQYVLFEKSYDRHSDQSKSIYRVNLQRSQNGIPGTSTALNFPNTGPEITRSFDGIIGYCRLFSMQNSFTKAVSFVNDSGTINTFNEDLIFCADPSFFELFPFLLKSGNKSALDRPFTAVLSETTSTRYFGEQDPVGRKIRFSHSRGDQEYTIAGVIEIPENTHLDIHILFSYESLRYGPLKGEAFNNWKNEQAYTYILLDENTKPHLLEDRFPQFIADKIGSPDNIEFQLQPITDIHTSPALLDGPKPTVSSQNLNLLLGGAFLILILATINYINISTGNSSKRGKEIALRLLSGASKWQVFWQFTLQFMVISVLALTISLVALTGLTHFGIPHLPLVAVLYILLIVMMVIIISSAYPAYVMIKRKGGLIHKKAKFHGVLVSIQFFISVGLIAFTIVVNRQIDFMEHHDLGFEIDNILIVKGPALSDYSDSVTALHNESFKEHLLSNAMISDVTYSGIIPGKENGWVVEAIRDPKGKEAVNLTFNIVNDNFIDAYGINLLAGRDFLLSDQRKGKFGEITESVILNTSATQKLGYHDFKDALGENIIVFDKKCKVIGVIDDFHQQSLQYPMHPAAYFLDKNASLFYSIKLKSRKNGLQAVSQETISQIGESFHQFFPGNPFDYFMLSDFFNSQYQREKKFFQLFSYLSILAIIISCFGLLSMSIQYSIKRTKEIGIRKVNGAKISEILVMLNNDFIKWVILAFVIASPVSWYAMDKWLENFAYKTELSWWVFALAGLIALGVALLTVSWQSWKAATRNPVEALRYE